MTDAEPRAGTPVVVVVDSRNVWGATRRQFGAGKRVIVEGVRAALRPYGFEAIDVFVGIASTTTVTHPSPRLARDLEVNGRYAAAVTASPFGHALVGRLIERRGDLQEKLVDVLCAMQIARSAHEIASGHSAAKAIVVFSEDMDLIPSYQFARDLQVPIYAAASATVETRPDSSWLLLGDSALRMSCERAHGRLYGQRLRQEICTWLTAPAPRRMSFRVRAWDPKRSFLRLTHNSGAIGIWRDPPPEVDHAVGATHGLHVVGLAARTSERDFPVVALSQLAEPWPPAALVTALVREWASPTQVVVILPTGPTQGIHATIGSLLPGDRVLVHEDQSAAPHGAWRLIGRLAAGEPIPGWRDTTAPALARVLTGATSNGQRVDAELLASAATVTLQPPGTDTPQAGDLYAVVPIGHLPVHGQPDRVLTIAVSSRLAHDGSGLSAASPGQAG